MRYNQNLSGARKTICRYGEPHKIYRSNGGGYDRDTMKWVGNGRVVKTINLAFFLRGGTIMNSDGFRLDYNAKFYSLNEIMHGDMEETQRDIIENDGKLYIVTFVDKRSETGCKPIYIGYCELYKGSLHKEDLARSVEK